MRPGFRPVGKGPISVVDGTDYQRRPGGCVTIAPATGVAARILVEVPSGGLSYRAAAAEQPELKLRRFDEGFAIVPKLPAGSAARVAIPVDRSNRPWQAEPAPKSRLELCP